MRLYGHNVFAIAVAAIAIYLIEFLIFAVLIPADQYMSLVGLQEGQGDPSRMPLGAVMPILAAVGLSLVIKWRNASTWAGGAVTALILAVVFGFNASLYSYVYGAETTAYLPINLGHYLVCWGAAGAILGGWR